MNKRDTAIKALNNIKKESERCHELYKLGVDLSNYEEGITTSCIEMISILIGTEKEEVEWWLFDQVDKIYYFDNMKTKFDVNKAEDFVDYYLKEK